MRSIVIVASLVFALAGAQAARADSSFVAPAVEDIVFSFGCNWGYEPAVTCGPLVSSPLVAGGGGGVLWRSALRFAVPRYASFGGVAATVAVWFTGRCAGTCASRTWTLAAHRLLGPWFAGREPVWSDSIFGLETVDAGAGPGWIRIDISDLVDAWLCGAWPNDGVLLRVLEERASEPGPLFASAEDPLPEHRPRLEVTVVPG